MITHLLEAAIKMLWMIGHSIRVNASSYQRIFETPSSRKSGVEI